MAKGLTAQEVKARINGVPGKYHDGKGLYLIVPKSGLAYWMLRYTINGKRREMTLKKITDLTLAEARTHAELKKRDVREGNDPIALRNREQQKEICTVNDLFEDWHQELVKRLKHPEIPKRIYTRDMSPLVGELPVEAVNPRDIRAIIQRVANSNRPCVANDALMYCKQLFNHAIKLDLVTFNPASAFTVSDAGGVEKSRDRVLSIEELKTVFGLFRQNRDQFTRDNYLACALLLVLGVRKGELTAAMWSEFDLANKRWSLPAERSKTGTAIIIPLPDQVINWLEELKYRGAGSDYVFPNRRTSKYPYMGSDTLNRAISKMFGREPGRKKQPPNKMGEIEHFTVHDLRRTCRSLLASLGVPGHVAERCMNHKLKGVEGIYDRYDYLNERREALEKVADLISPLTDVNDR